MQTYQNIEDRRSEYESSKKRNKLAQAMQTLRQFFSQPDAAAKIYIIHGDATYQVCDDRYVLSSALQNNKSALTLTIIHELLKFDEFPILQNFFNLVDQNLKSTNQQP